MRLPWYERWDEQFYDRYCHDGNRWRASEVPGSDAPETAEEDREAHNPEQSGFALDAWHDPPDDDGQANVPTRHEAKLTIKIWIGCLYRNVELDTQKQPERANGERQQTQNQDDQLKGSRHVTPNEWS